MLQDVHVQLTPYRRNIKEQENHITIVYSDSTLLVYKIYRRNQRSML